MPICRLDPSRSRWTWSSCAASTRTPEVRQRGRSAFIRSAIEMYLRARHRREIDEQLRNAYAGHADELLEEISDLMDAQEWPPE